MGGIDIVVSNAVYSDRHLFLDSDLNEFRKTIDVSMGEHFTLFAPHVVNGGAESRR